MFCDQCGNPVGDSEKFCSRCGAPILPIEPEQAAAPAESEKVEQTAQTQTPVTSVEPEQAAPAVPVSEPAADSGKKGGKKTGLKVVLLCIGVLALALVSVCVVNAGKIGNFLSRSFSSPEKYYRQVEQDTVSEIAGRCAAYYGMLLQNPFKLEDTNFNAEFTLAVGEGGRDFLSLLDMAGEDISWLSDVKWGVGLSWKENVFAYALSFGLNKTDILSANMLMDIAGGNLYIQVPELNEKYMGLDGYDAELYGAEALELYQEMQETHSKMLAAMPEAEEVEKLLQKYLNLALDSIDDVGKKQQTLKAGGVSQKCTELEVTFDGKCLADMLEAIIKEMLKDKDLKKLITGMADSLAELDDFAVYSMGGEEAYEEFIGELEEALEGLDELKDLDGELIMKVYVSSQGRIVGRTLETADTYGDRTEICFLTPESGSKVGCEISVTADDGGSIALTGSGKKSGDKLTGSYELEYANASLLELNVSGLDLEQLEKGYLNGTITLAPSKMLGTLLTGSLSGYGSIYATMLADMELKLDSLMSKDQGKLTLGLLYDEKEIVSLSVSAAMGKGPEAKIPSGGSLIMMEEEEDLLAWLEGVHWDNFLGKLEKAGIPQDIMEEIRDGIELLSSGSYLYNGIYGSDAPATDPYGWDDNDEPYGAGGWNDDYGDGVYGEEPGSDYSSPEVDAGSQAAAEGLLEEILQSEDWKDELKDWNESVAELGITLDTVAEGNILVFVYRLSDDSSFDESLCGTVADIFLETLENEDFISAFYAGYGISLDAVRCTFVRSDGSEIYRNEIY